MPYFISKTDIFSDNLGCILPIKKPTKINGNILINNLLIALNLLMHINSITKQQVNLLFLFTYIK